MYKNNELFYCYLPTTQKEDIIWVPRQDDEPADLYDMLYEVKKPLGQVLFSLLSLANDVLVAADIEHTHAISDAVMYNYFDRYEWHEINRNPFNRDYGRRFLKRCFQNARTTSANIDDLDTYIWFFNKFIDSYINNKCSQEELDKFCRKLHKGKKQAEIVQLDLEEYSCLVGQVETTEDTLDTILISYSFTEEQRISIRNTVEPYLDSPKEFCKILKDCLSRYVPAHDLIITYHIYPLNDLFDLFSATLQEVIAAKAAIIRCKCCEKLFVSKNRTDEKYCSLSCKRIMVEGFKKCSKLYHEIYNRLCTYGESDNTALNQFLDDYHDKKGKVESEKDLKDLISWLRNVPTKGQKK